MNTSVIQPPDQKHKRIHQHILVHMLLVFAKGAQERAATKDIQRNIWSIEGIVLNCDKYTFQLVFFGIFCTKQGIFYN